MAVEKDSDIIEITIHEGKNRIIKSYKYYLKQKVSMKLI